MSLSLSSFIELPFPATVRPGHRWLTGRSWSGEGRISNVEVAFDDSRRWRPAQLARENSTQAWRQWSVPFNEQGYLFGAVVAHPVSVG